jgi:hypothetical protein
MKDLRFANILLVEDCDVHADSFQDFFERQRIGGPEMPQRITAHVSDTR